MLVSVWCLMHQEAADEAVAEARRNAQHYLLRDMRVDCHRGVVRFVTPNKRWTIQVQAVA